MEYNFALIASLLFVIILLMVAHRFTTKQRLFNKLISNAKSRSMKILREAKAKQAETDADIEKRIEEINAREASSEARIERLKEADREIRARLKESRALIEDITDRSCQHAADIELLTEEDLQSSKSYVDDRKAVKARLKKLATDAIENVRGHNADVNVGKFVAISAKADMAGALLLSVVEMLCSKVTSSSGHLAAEKLAETIIATEALVKAIDSRAEINGEMKALLMKRLEIEINYKKAKQIAKEEQRELREQQREEKKHVKRQ